MRYRPLSLQASLLAPLGFRQAGITRYLAPLFILSDVEAPTRITIKAVFGLSSLHTVLTIYGRAII